MYCTKCGSEIQDEAVICVHCGVAVKTPAQFQARAAKQKENKLTFVFVTSLIFMIIFATRGIAALGALFDWRAVRRYDFAEYASKSDVNSLCNLAALYYIFVLVFFATVLAVFIITATLRNNQGSSPKNRILFSKIIFISAAVTCALSVILIIVQIVFLIRLDDFAVSISEITVYIDYGIRSTLNESWGTLVFDFTYLIFAVINVIKAWFFFCETKRGGAVSE